tara:strand:+ start:137 stop:847 length:711 start_codon:yes stop_codon:yes gene_type:complete
MVISQIISYLGYFLELTITPGVLWNVVPLAIATLLILIYYQVNIKEHADWSSFFSNSLVLLFVSMNLFRYIYTIGGVGSHNFVEHFVKTSITAILLLFGLLLVRFNFQHVLPEKISKYISSPLSVNSFAYVIILAVYSTKPVNWIFVISLIILLVLLIVMLNLMKIPLRLFKNYIDKEKKKERAQNAKEAVFQIKELKRKLNSQEKELRTIRLKEVESEKKEGLTLKKIINKVIKK